MASQEREFEGTSTQVSNSSWSLSGVKWNNTQADEDGLYESDEREERVNNDQQQFPQVPAYSTQPPPSRTPSFPRLSVPSSHSTPVQQHQLAYHAQAPPTHSAPLIQSQQVPPRQHFEVTAVHQPSTPNQLPSHVAELFSQGSTRNAVAQSQRLAVAPFVDNDIKLIDNSNPAPAPAAKKSSAASSTSKKRASKAASTISNKKTKTQKSTQTADDSKGGRKSGSTNYSDFELRVLVGFVSEIKPTGSDGWEDVTRRYNVIAQREDLTTRMKEGLKKKFYALVNSQKPTGDPDCPEVIRLAKRADRDIQEKTHTVDVDDSDSNSDIESGKPVVPATSATPAARPVAVSAPSRDESPEAQVVFKRELSTPTPATNWATWKSSSQRTNPGAEALKQMTSFLDPSVRTQMNNNQAVNNLFLTQIQSLESQLRYKDEEMDKLRKEMCEVERAKDVQMEGLRQEIRKLEKEVADAQRASDRLENELQMLRMLQQHPMHKYRDPYSSYEDQELRYRYSEQESLARLEARRQRQGGTIFPPQGHRVVRSPSPSQQMQNSASRVPPDSSSADSLLVTFGNGERITLSPLKRAPDL